MMRRPLLYVAVVYAAAIIISYYQGIQTALAAAAIPAAAWAASGRRTAAAKAEKGGSGVLKKKRFYMVLFLVYVASVFLFYADQTSSEGRKQCEGEQTRIRGEVIEREDRETGGDGDKMVRVTARLTGAQDGRGIAPVKVLVNYYGESGEADVIPGDVFEADGVFTEPAGRRNPACFDYALYLKSIGISGVMTARSMETVRKCGESTFAGRVYTIKENFLDKLEEETEPGTSAMMRAMLFGNKSDLGEDVLDEFRKNGTAHVLAVSGLHVGIVYGVISFLWRGRKGWLYFVAATLVLICYAAMASWSPSAVRAVFMICLHMFSKVRNKRYDLSSAAFLSALVMMAMNPMCIFNTGFQMSYLAVLTMALLIPFIKRAYNGLLLSGAAIQAGLMPYTAYMFNYLSPAAVFVNVPIIFITGIIVPLGLCSMAAAAVCGPVFHVLAQTVGRLCGLLEWMNSMTAVDGILVFSVTSPNIAVLSGYYLFLLIFMSEEGRLAVMRRRKKTMVIMALALVSAAWCFGNMAGDDFRKAEVVFVDVGQGDCIHFRTENGKNYMIDGGGSINYNMGKKTLKPYLLKNGVKKLDGAFVTHLHTDHYKGIAELCREGMVDKLFIYDGNKVKEDDILRDTGLKAEDLEYLHEGQTVRLSDGTGVEVLWPEQRSVREYERMAENDEDENESSLLLKLNVGGRSVLATGDVDEACQDAVSRKWKKDLKCDVVKVAHHGSKYSYSSEFTEMAAPGYAVFQVGKNNYGHPDKGVIENYEGNGIMIYRNDMDGAVGFDFGRRGRTDIMTVVGDQR